MAARFQRWLAPPVFPGEDAKTRRAYVLNLALVSVLALVPFVIAGSLLWARSPFPGVGILFCWLVACLFLGWWMRQGQVMPAAVGFLGASLVVVTACVAAMGSIRTPSTGAYLLLIVSAGLLFDVRGVLATAALCSLLVGALIVAQVNGRLPRPDYTVSAAQWATCSALFAWAAILVASTLRSLNRTLGRLAREIADRQRTEEALAASEARLRKLFEDSPIGIAFLDAQRRFFLTNRRYRDLTGYTEPEIIERGLKGLLHPDDWERSYALSTRLREGEIPTLHLEQRYVRKDGAVACADSQITAIRDRDGRLLYTIAWVQDVTERNLVEERLRQEQAINQAIFDSVPGAIFLYDEEWRLVRWNKQLETLIGRPGENLTGRHALDSFVEADAPHVTEAIRKLFAEGRAEVEADLRASDGRTVPCFFTGVSLTIAGERYFTGIGLDISERRKAERLILLLQEAIDAHPDGAYWFDSQSRLVYANEAGCRILDLSLEELAGRHVSDINPKATPEALERMWEALRRGGSFSIESTHRRRDGSEFPVGITAVYVRIGGQEYYCGFARDITQAKRSEEQIRKLSAAVEQSPASIVITDPNGAIEYVNPKFTQLTGYTPEEAIGQNPRILKGDRTSAEDYRRLWETIRQGRVWRGEFHNRKKSGELYWESALISPIFDAHRRITHFVAVKEDITERKGLEEQLRQAQKLESIGQLAGGVAHDFNNILAAMMLRLGLLQEDPKLAPDTLQAVKELLLHSKRASSVTRQLLLFSRRSAMEPKPLDLNEIVTNLLRMARQLIGEHIDLRFERRDGLPLVEADPGMIEQVMINLLVNARDAMPRGGQVSITLEPAQLEPGRAVPSTRAAPGPYACLAVTDNGCGMEPATLGRIFEPFFTTKPAGKGTGLGLATVHGIVAQHRGWIEVDSEPGKGSTFRVFLPAGASSVPETAQNPSSAPPGGNETILLVEDEVSVRQVLGRALRTFGYGILEAGTGPEALSLWQEHRQTVRLLLTDMVMPEGMTGLELAERLKAEAPALKVIICSGYDPEGLSQAALRQKGMLALPKPFSIQTLARRIRECLDDHPAPNPR